MCPEGVTLEIRPAHLGEILQLVRLHNAIAQELFGFLDQRPWDPKIAQEGFLTRSKRYPVWVAAYGREVLGFALLDPYRDLPAFRDVAEVTVAVAEPHRRQGLASALLMAVTEAAALAGHSRLVAQVAGPNEAARHLLRRQGFREAGLLSGLLLLEGRRCDLVLYENPLSGTDLA